MENFSREICALTFPLIEHYAEKIGAEFHPITVRRFPDWPVTYQKFAIYELAQEFDWNIYVDVDALIHPDLPDITAHLPKDTIALNDCDLASMRFRTDRFFERDGRYIAAGNFFSVASNLCVDLWKPLDDLTLEEALSNIYPAVLERNIGMTREHLIDDYVVSRNIAKYGLKYKGVVDILREHGQPTEGLWHDYLASTPAKVAAIKNKMREWRLP